MSSMKCPTPLAVKYHKALCVKGDYNRMEPFAIGEPLKLVYFGRVGYFNW